MEIIPRKLSTRTARERKLALLIRVQHAASDEVRRQALLANWPTVHPDMVARFVGQLERFGMSILSPESHHISADERLALNILAVSQRHAPSAEIVDPALRCAAEAFGAQLKDSGVWLPLHAPLADALANGGRLFRGISGPRYPRHEQGEWQTGS